MHNSKLIYVLVILVGVSVAKGDVDKLIERLHALREFRVEYNRVMEFDPDPKMQIPPSKNGLEVAGEIKARRELYRDVLQFRIHTFLYEAVADDATMKSLQMAAPDKRTIVAFSSKRFEVSSTRNDRKRPLGMIQDKGGVPYELIIDVGMGMRLHTNEWQPLNRELLKKGVLETSGDKLLWTYTAPNKEVHILEFKAELGYAMTRYTIKSGNSDASMEIIPSDFVNVDGYMLPSTVFRQNTYRDTSGKLRNPVKIKISEAKYKLIEPKESTENYFIRWPAGAAVVDVRTSETFNIQENEGVILTDETILKIFTEREAGKQAELEEARKRIEEVKKRSASER